MLYRYYLKSDETLTANLQPLPDGYKMSYWQPRLLETKPGELPWYPFLVWWVMHYCRLFESRNYGMLLVHHSGKLVHRSCIFPKFFWFPSMTRGDLQIGDTWTALEHRGKGLATFALQAILMKH